MLQVAVVSPFVWSTFLKKAVDPGLFAEFSLAEAGAADSRAPVRTARGQRAKRGKAVRKSKTPTDDSDERRLALCHQVTEAVGAVLGGTVG